MQLATILFTLILFSLYFLWRRFFSVSHQFPGPKNGEVKALFRDVREDAHLVFLRKFSPNRTLLLDNVISTADPKFISQLLSSRVNSVGRSLVYRLIAWWLPYSDGMLFVGNKEWERRHKLFTSLFQSGVVKGYMHVACQGAATVARIWSQEGRVDARDVHQTSTYPPSLEALECDHPQGELGGEEDPHISLDLLQLVRSAALRTFLAWSAGLNPDEEGPHSSLILRSARCLDGYSRQCFEILPSLQKEGLFSWLKGYLRLKAFGLQLRDCVGKLISLHPPPVGTGAVAPSPVISSRSSIPGTPLDTPLSRMLKDNWSIDQVTSEINHLHGAHKAIALIATAALCELSEAHPSIRERLVDELVSVCGMKNGKDGELCPPRLEDMEKLPTLSNVWRETLRRHVVSMGTLRHVMEGMEVGMESGKDVLILLHALHHDTELWGPDAHCWEPERWNKKSSYWDARLAWERSSGKGDTAAAAATECSSSKFWSPGSPSHPGGEFIPATETAAFSPFLDGLRRCAGMHFARLQFAAILYAFLVPFQVSIIPPCTPTEALQMEGGEAEVQEGTPLAMVGGGTALLPGATCVAREGCLAYIREPSLPFTTPSRLDLELESLRGKGVASSFHYRLHLVKLADMFTTLDGHIAFKISKR